MHGVDNSHQWSWSKNISHRVSKWAMDLKGILTFFLTVSVKLQQHICGFRRKPHIFFWTVSGFSETLTVYLRFHDFLGFQKLEPKLVSLKGFDWEGGQVASLETKCFDWDGGWVVIETKGFDWDGQSNTLGFNEYHPTSFSVEHPWFQWNSPALLLSRITLRSNEFHL